MATVYSPQDEVKIIRREAAFMRGFDARWGEHLAAAYSKAADTLDQEADQLEESLNADH